MKKSAHLSEDGVYRYSLTREWDDGLPILTFVMLNPSTADATTDDATIRKCIGFGQRLGFGGILVVNLFSFRARDPGTLRLAGYPGAAWKDNGILTKSLRFTKETKGIVCCAWGSNARDPRIAARAGEVLGLIKDLGITPYALRVLHDGIPSHPLMLAYTNPLQEFKYV